jgi:hypothetical protein
MNRTSLIGFLALGFLLLSFVPQLSHAQTLDEMLRERYLHAVANFASLDQDEAIDLFSSVIEFLESQAERRALQHQELVMLGSSHFYRAAAKLNLGIDEDGLEDFVYMRLDNDNFREVIAALESCSGKTVEGAEGL